MYFSFFNCLFQINFIISTILKQITIEVTPTISFPLGFKVHLLVQNAYSGAIYEEKYSLLSPREPKMSEAHPALFDTCKYPLYFLKFRDFFLSQVLPFTLLSFINCSGTHS